MRGVIVKTNKMNGGKTIEELKTVLWHIRREHVEFYRNLKQQFEELDPERATTLFRWAILKFDDRQTEILRLFRLSHSRV